MASNTLNLFRQANLYSLYVLLVLLAAYLLNQLDRYTLAIVTKPLAQEIHYGDKACMRNETVTSSMTNKDCMKVETQEKCIDLEVNGTSGACKWDYTGQGYDYQILAGPIFILVYTFAAIPVGIAADLYNRKVLLGVSVAFWSVCTFLSGFVTSYWQLAVLRFGIGLGEAGCTPFATSLISDYFNEELRGVALGVYNWGIYTGYSMSYALGNFITQANINGQSWRWAFFIAGMPGILLGIVIMLTVKEPSRITSKNPVDMKGMLKKEGSLCTRVKEITSPFLRPSLLFLCLAGSIRNAAGYVWAYNTQIYFEGIGQSQTDIGMWMSWIPLVAGSIGVVFGGFISDRVVSRTGPHGRIWVLIASQMSAAPFAAGVLFLDPPYSYISLIPTYIIGEMWVSVTLAVLVELVPAAIKTSAVAVYFFIISNIGGNMPLVVPLIKNAFLNMKYSNMEALRNALYILYPGEYVLGSLLFLLTLFVLKRDIHYIQSLENDKCSDSDHSSEEGIPSTNSSPSYGSTSKIYNYRETGEKSSE